MIDTGTSPWYPYLSAVYGGRVPLPFNLTSLSFFYHNDANWRLRHPRVDWPMATCNGEHRSAHPPRRCADCSKWEMPTAAVPPVRRFSSGVLGVLRIGDGPWNFEQTRRSAGSLIVGSEGRHAQPGRELAASAGALIEVMRVGRPRMLDGTLGETCMCEMAAQKLGIRAQLGCWFVRATGSGIFLRVGRTLVLTGPKQEGTMRLMAEAYGLPHTSSCAQPASPTIACHRLTARPPFLQTRMAWRDCGETWGAASRSRTRRSLSSRPRRDTRASSRRIRRTAARHAAGPSGGRSSPHRTTAAAGARRRRRAPS